MIPIILATIVIVAITAAVLGYWAAGAHARRYITLDERVHVPEFGGAWKACRDGTNGDVVYFDHNGKRAVTIRRYTSGAALATVFKHHEEVLKRA